MRSNKISFQTLVCISAWIMTIELARIKKKVLSRNGKFPFRAGTEQSAARRVRKLGTELSAGWCETSPCFGDLRQRRKTYTYKQQRLFVQKQVELCNCCRHHRYIWRGEITSPSSPLHICLIHEKQCRAHNFNYNIPDANGCLILYRVGHLNG